MWLSTGLSALLITANVLLATASAIPAAAPDAGLEVKRDLSGDNAKPMIAQVDKAREILGDVEDSEVDKDLPWDQVTTELKKALKEKEKGLVKYSPGFIRRLRVLFIEFCGTKGDVGKGEYYYSKVEESSVCTPSQLFLEALKRPKDRPLYHLRFAIDCDAIQYLSEGFKKDHAQDIRECQKTRADSRQRVLDLIKSHKPDIILRGNAAERLYFKDEDKLSMDFWTDITAAINDRTHSDVSAVFDIKSYAKLPYEMKRAYEYQLTPKRQTLVGQTPDWYSDFALLNDEERDGKKFFGMRQIFIGRAVTPGGNKVVPDHLKKWMEDGDKKIAYFGSGGNKRKKEAEIKDILPVYKRLIEDVLANDKYKDWKIIIMHYADKPKGVAEGPEDDVITHDGRVYHLWYGNPLMEIWKMKQVKMISHHCGKGSFDDVILVNGEGEKPEENYKAQLCIDQLGYGKDMKFWKARLEHFQIGKGAPAIGFKDSTKPDNEYEGIPDDYSDEDHKKVFEAFEVVASDYHKMGERSLPFKPPLQADTAIDLFLRSVNYVGLGLIKRRIAGKKLDDAPLPELEKDAETEPGPVIPAPQPVDRDDPVADVPDGDSEEECGTPMGSDGEDSDPSQSRKRGESIACGINAKPPPSDPNPEPEPSSSPASTGGTPPQASATPQPTDDGDGPLNPQTPPGPFTPTDEFNLPGIDRREDASGWEF